MNIQIFGTKKCTKTGKALRFFKDRGIPVHFVDLNEKGISKGELTKVVQSAGIDDLIDPESKEYKKRGMNYIEFDPFEEALESPLLINTPIVRSGNKSVLGESPARWKEFLEKG